MSATSSTPASLADILAVPPESRPPLELPGALWKKVTSLGFALTKLLTAHTGVLRQIEKRSELESLRRFLPPSALENHSSPDGLFASSLTFSESNLKVMTPFLDPQSIVELSTKLTKVVDAGLMTEEPRAAILPRDANASLWPALLRLRPLHDFWERELRSNHLELLTELMPDAWLFDLTPLPPHAVIPRLELAAWSQLIKLHDSGRSFELSAAWEKQPHWMLHANDSETAWKSTLEEAFAVGAMTPLVLAEQTALPQTMIAFYQQKDKRVELAAAFAFNQEESDTMAVSQVRR